MPEPQLPDRQYGDREVSLILKRAFELQRSASDEGARGSGLSLTDLEQVAREAGLDPELVRRAAAEVASGAGGGGGGGGAAPRWLGAPTRLSLQRVVPGEIGEDTYALLVEEIRRTEAEVGLVTRLGRSLTWTATRASPGSGIVRTLVVTVAVRDGRTFLHAEESLGQLAGALFGGLVGGVGGGGIALAILAATLIGSAGLGAGVWAACTGGSYALARTLFRAQVARHARELNALLDRMAEYAAESMRKVPSPAPPPPPLLP